MASIEEEERERTTILKQEPSGLIDVLHFVSAHYQVEGNVAIGICTQTWHDKLLWSMGIVHLLYLAFSFVVFGSSSNSSSSSIEQLVAFVNSPQFCLTRFSSSMERKIGQLAALAFVSA